MREFEKRTDRKRNNLCFSLCMLWLFTCIFLSSLAQGQDVIGTVEETLTVEGKGNTETTLGYFFTDAILDAANTDAAILPSSMLQMPLKKGDITENTLIDLTEYGEDTLVIVKVNGEILKALFEQSFRLYSRENINFLHGSGLRVTFDPLKKPGERVTLLERRAAIFPLNFAAEFLFPEIEKFYYFYVKVKPEAAYKLATLKFSAFGPMGYYKIFSDKQIIKVLPVTLHQALIRYVQKKKTLRYENENRVIYVPPPPEEETTETP